MRSFLTIIFLGLATISSAQKRPLDHAVYDSWMRLRSAQISDNGRWIIYQLNPGKGDSRGVILSADKTSIKNLVSISEMNFWGASGYVSYTQRPRFEVQRQEKLKKTAKDKLAPDTLYIYDLENQRATALPSKSSRHFYQKEEPVYGYLREVTIPRDTTDKKSKIRKFERLVIHNLMRGDSITIDSVKQFRTNSNKLLKNFLYVREKDSVASVWLYQAGQQTQLLEVKKGEIGSLALDEKGDQGAFTATADTGKVKIFDVYYFKTAQANHKKFAPENLHQALYKVIPEGYCTDQSVSFNKSGDRLNFSFIKRPVEEPKDTLTSDEKVKVDIWSTTDTVNMAQQLVSGSGIPKSYIGIYFPTTGKSTAVTRDWTGRLSFHNDEQVEWVLSQNMRPYISNNDWEYPWPEDLRLINVRSGEVRLIGKKMYAEPNFNAPRGAYFVWFDAERETWNAYDVKSGKSCVMSSDKRFVEPNDNPTLQSSYGSAGWNERGDRFYVYDRYDLWELDPTGKNAARCVSGEWGAKNRIMLRYLPVEYRPVEKAGLIDTSKPLLLKGFQDDDKREGFYQLSLSDGVVRELTPLEDYNYTPMGIAKKADRWIWSRENFTTPADLWVSDKTMRQATKLSDLDKQTNDYRWGSVEMMTWNDFEGKKSTGLLYKPENYDPSRRYPVIVYFYEKSSDSKNTFHVPQPSWSIIIPSMFTSNDYVIFIPDIEFKTGYPGESGYNKIVSGATALIERGVADPARMALQGQSWGGYLTSYVVTRTNMFRCASPGAPVSNMTSAYTGIRSGTGLVRMFMYEHGQSRIGASLWEAPMLYLENSPLFYVPKIETPLLIRHDDADEAVPYEQGIEFYMALRRCGKRAWLVNYNGQPHNLRGWAQRVDWAIRMHQFFDYYLKDAPMPRWMSEGISVDEKGKDFKYDLSK